MCVNVLANAFFHVYNSAMVHTKPLVC